MQGLGKLKDKKINCIPNNTEKYIDNLDFIDLLQFMNASLEKLVSNLAKNGVDKFPILQEHIDSDKVPLLLRKGVYPYDHMDCMGRFEELSLPPKELFYNVLTTSIFLMRITPTRPVFSIASRVGTWVTTMIYT